MLIYKRLRIVAIFASTLMLCLSTFGADQVSDQPDIDKSTELGDRLLAEYFQLETAALSTEVVTPGMTLPKLKTQQSIDRQRLAEMLGLDPMPKRTPLEAVVVSTEARDGFRVQRLHFQPSPGLYVAANFYLPLKVDQALPTILYVCGHANTEANGVRPGNKAAYHHHGVWFARNGYACLIVDTIQLGEFAGQHHGTYRWEKWWWNNRGYTPAGVEAWTGIRALDYLETRQEVDANRFGITGRSGGGAYSWWIAALDQRIKVAVPVAGITTLRNHVVDGCVEGHCDCMYMINTYRWDYARVAALMAPRPLLISNSDKDSLFPLDGVVEIHRQVRDVYDVHSKPDHLGLQITEGPHKDTQELRVHAFRWFNRFLKNDESLIRTPAEQCIELSDLAVFDHPPNDEQVTTVDEWFIPQAHEPIENWLESLRDKSFAGWPSEDQVRPLRLELVAENEKDGVRCEVYEFDSQQPYRLPLFVISINEPSTKVNAWTLETLNQEQWGRVAGGIASMMPQSLPNTQASSEDFEILAERVRRSPDRKLVLFAPRGIGPTEWTRDPTERVHIRRRFMLLGQTQDAMRIWDLRRAIAAVRAMPTYDDASLTLRGSNHAAAWALYASLFDQHVSELEMRNLPTSHRDGITLLNVERVVDMATVVQQAGKRSKLSIIRD
ncbi:Alpha/beta hydrolase family protein [Rubripirellula amarantea]|uniref:Alpha/beta hydrolase family protein n=1 Tax=Rubripirellula amarantea TaxID=2527999 RepID=A0A5C5WBJ4_9BACT|nr:prolyl oligopeptidase family serine peptidase [Rubripirellula amarantea]TWT48004.1 Alpha/beta hydrolase family protein [Rubripirellula amarantea]